MTVARLALFVAAITAASPAHAGSAGRFAVIAGNDIGAPGRPRLWFAEKDAQRFRNTLVELGEFDAANVVLLTGGSPAAIREALDALERRVRAARAVGERTLLVFYYSGHAGSGGLELGTESLAFGELRERIIRAEADAKVAIVDACEAGLLTQVKGAAPAPLLDFALPPEETARGTAFVASTAVGEVAQESAALGGSFFTHHLEAALRGAADADGDGVVTLAEAFRYTAAQTVAGTAGTREGPQHPTYDFKMSGRGDVALSDLRRADAHLRIPASPDSRYVLRGPGGMLVEVAGTGSDVVLAVPAGRYGVERRSELGRATGSIDLMRGDALTLPALVPTRYEMARAKGGPKAGLVYLGGGVLSTGLAGFGVAPLGRIALRSELGPVGLRVRIDLARKNVTDADLKYDFLGVGGGVAAFVPLNVGAVLVEAGPEVGYLYATQRLSTGVSHTAGIVTAGVAMLATAPVGPLRLGLDATVGAGFFQLNERRTVKPSASAGLMALYGF